MAGLVEIKDEYVINICPVETRGDVITISELDIQLPKQPLKKDILYHDLPKEQQRWVRKELPEELRRIASMEQWLEMPDSFRAKHTPYIAQEYERRRKGL